MGGTDGALLDVLALAKRTRLGESPGARDAMCAVCLALHLSCTQTLFQVFWGLLGSYLAFGKATKEDCVRLALAVALPLAHAQLFRCH